MSAIELTLTPLRHALREREDNTLEVLLRVQAPAETVRPRSPVNLTLVIDRSGSMAGQPLEEAKRCASRILGFLGPNDRASLVAYDQDIRVYVPSQPVRDRHLFEAALADIRSGGQTALYEGWLRGAEQTARGVLDIGLSRVLLLSDGQANVGPRGTAEIAPRCAEMADSGVSTSTYGLGRSFNEDLMIEMARAGSGNAYYGQTADDLMEPFLQEFELMCALYARHLRLVLDPVPGVRAEVVNRYPKDIDGRVMLPDLAHGAEAWVLLRLVVPRDLTSVSSVEFIQLLGVKLEFRDLEGRANFAGPIYLQVPCVSAQAHAAIDPDELVSRRVHELRAATLQETARTAARRRDWKSVRTLMDELRAHATESPWLAASLDDLEAYVKAHDTERFSKETAYKAHAMRSRLTSQAEARDWRPDDESEQPSFLRRKLEQGRRFDPKKDDRPPR